MPLNEFPGFALFFSIVVLVFGTATMFATWRLFSIDDTLKKIHRVLWAFFQGRTYDGSTRSHFAWR